MRNYILLVFFIAPFFLACETDVELKEEFRQEYVINCILDLSSSTQYLTISKSYYDEKSPISEHALKGAKVKISAANFEASFTESNIVPNDINVQNRNFTFYKLENFKPMRGVEYNLTAELPDGKILTSSTKTPYYNLFVFEVNEYLTVGETNTRIYWSIKEPSYSPVINLPRVKLVYYKIQGKDTVKHEVVIPEKFNKKGEPLHFLASDKPIVYIDSEIFNDKMKEISGADTSKFNYLISHIEAKIMIMDKNLGTYYLAVQNPQDGISVLLNQVEFTNVNNGFGIFGSYLNEKKDFFLTEDYIKKFKYKKFYRKE